jgi:hypothetical protein
MKNSTAALQGTKKHQRRGRLFVDAGDTTIDHIGELKIPIERGVIGKETFWPISTISPGALPGGVRRTTSRSTKTAAARIST